MHVIIFECKMNTKIINGILILLMMNSSVEDQERRGALGSLISLQHMKKTQDEHIPLWKTKREKKQLF
jgi:hypothetical protein